MEATFSPKGSTLIYKIIWSTIGLLLAPIVGIILLLFKFYRDLVKISLSKRDDYIGLMDGSDAYWVLESATSRPIINILAFIDFQNKLNLCKGIDQRAILKEVLEKKLLNNPNLFKLKCLKRMSEYGYYYWVKHNIDIDQHVRWMKLNNPTIDSLQDYLSEISNNALPYNNNAFWEILVSRDELKIEEKNLHPVVFRVHHAVGDGIALVQMFLDSLSDPIENNIPEMSPMKKIQEKYKNQSFTKCKNISDNVIIQMGIKLTFAFIKKLNISRDSNESLKLSENCIYTIMNILRNISILIYAPLILVSQCFMKCDKSFLHGPYLTGEKIIVWGSDKYSLTKVRVLKDKLKCHFTDIILLAVSNSFESYLSYFAETPSHFTLIIPARMPTEFNDQTEPSNEFTVAMMKLPIKCHNKFKSICSLTYKLRSEPYYIVNYWLLKVVCSYFPILLLRKALESKQATMAISNIPGPSKKTKIYGNTIDDLFFWLPNRNTTGVGISVLSYNGKLNFGLIVDKALIPEKKEAQNILSGFIQSIDEMYQDIT